MTKKAINSGKQKLGQERKNNHNRPHGSGWIQTQTSWCKYSRSWEPWRKGAAMRPGAGLVPWGRGPRMGKPRNTAPVRHLGWGVEVEAAGPLRAPHLLCKAQSLSLLPPPPLLGCPAVRPNSPPFLSIFKNQYSKKKNQYPDDSICSLDPPASTLGSAPTRCSHELLPQVCWTPAHLAGPRSS